MLAAIDRGALAARELAGFLRLGCTLDEESALRTAIKRRIATVANGLEPEDQAWFIETLHKMSMALRGAGHDSPVISAMLARLYGTEAADALTAGPRAYKSDRMGGRTIEWRPATMVSLAVGQAATDFKSSAPNVKQFMELAAVGSADLVRSQAPVILAAAQAAWRDGTYDADWARMVERLKARSAMSMFPWGLNDLSMIAALTAPDRIDGSPWLGPLKVTLTEALREGDPWTALLTDVLAGDGGAKPGKGFAAKAAKTLEAFGTDAFRERVMGWLDQHPLDPQNPDPDADALKQLIWYVGVCGEEAAAPLSRFAQRCFVKIPNIGARSVKLGNAALAALGLIEPPTAGAAELDRLRQRVKYPSALKQIEAAFDVAAKRAGLTAEDLVELAVPDFDLGSDGCVRVTSDHGGAVLSLTAGRRVELEWHDAAGKTQASPPAALKKADPALVKSFTERRKTLEAMLAGQISRIERLFEEDRHWDGATWTSRYAKHGLLGPLSRRLIWRVERADKTCDSFMPSADGLVAADGRTLDLTSSDRVRLWHPIDVSVDEVLAWRAAVVARGIVQPFKQAHREIYRLTDAERATDTYSNRFAGHILRQHQMLELAKSRGWTGTLQGSFDNANNPTKEYKSHGLRVEYWAEGIEGQDGDLGHSGICLRVATDRVMFHTLVPALSRMAMFRAMLQHPGGGFGPVAKPVRLVDVPPRLLSEALRDVDLFVGVASLGSDPNWADGGPAGRFGEYWRSYAEADLEESGKMRHATLAALLPRLAIAEHCTLEARHLVVRGRLKTYRIHIGSGSIFFQPEGRYLCIVQDRSGRKEEVALPFEGDGMLTMILSKATLLVRDDLIKDKSILTQLRVWP